MPSQCKGNCCRLTRRRTGVEMILIEGGKEGRCRDDTTERAGVTIVVDLRYRRRWRWLSWVVGSG
jgi:hypothetical protein